MPKNYQNLDLPAGIRSNGTVYSNRGQWIDGSRIRWHNNALRPIGGWRPFTVADGQLDEAISDPSIEKARSALGYKMNDGTNMYVVGTNRGLKAWSKSSQTVYDITPPSFANRPYEVADPTGYGMWFYGEEAYGTERPSSSIDEAIAFFWTFRNWGQNLLAAPYGPPSRLYQWDGTFANKAAVIPNAPTQFDCFHVTDERIVMVAGQPDEPRLIQWSTSENNNQWTPTQQNQAGFQTLPGTGRFRAILSVQDKYLLVSETDAYVCWYQGPPYVYGFDQVGVDCGTVAPNGVVSTENFAMWPGKTCFYIFDGAVVRPVECDVMDRFSQTINSSQVSKTFGFVNPGWSEIWWLYQEGDDDVDSYVAYNWVRGDWTIGKLDRTCAAGNDAMGGLFMVGGTDGLVYAHELVDVAPVDVDQSEVFVESGPIELTNNNTVMYISDILPDYKSEGVVKVTLIGRDRPTSPEIIFGPYSLGYPALHGQPVPVRARGHSIRYRVEGSDQTWIQGSVRLNFKNGGER